MSGMSETTLWFDIPPSSLLPSSAHTLCPDEVIQVPPFAILIAVRDEERTRSGHTEPAPNRETYVFAYLNSCGPQLLGVLTFID